MYKNWLSNPHKVLEGGGWWVLLKASIVEGLDWAANWDKKITSLSLLKDWMVQTPGHTWAWFQGPAAGVGLKGPIQGHPVNQLARAKQWQLAPALATRWHLHAYNSCLPFISCLNYSRPRAHSARFMKNHICSSVPTEICRDSLLKSDTHQEVFNKFGPDLC